MIHQPNPRDRRLLEAIFLLGALWGSGSGSPGVTAETKITNSEPVPEDDPHRVTPRDLIIDGSNVDDLRDHPWFAAGKFSKENDLSFAHANDYWMGCGASLIASRYVLTAAHCVWDPHQYLIYILHGLEQRKPIDPIEYGLQYRVGFSGFCPGIDLEFSRQGGGLRQPSPQFGIVTANTNCGVPFEDINAVSIHLHDTNEEGALVDLALIELERPSNAQPVAVDGSGDFYESLPLGGRMAVIGSGQTSGKGDFVSSVPRSLQTVDVLKAENEYCIEKFGELVDPFKWADPSQMPSMACSRPVDGTRGQFCSGDSGGPLIAKNAEGEDTLVAVISAAKDDCLGEASAYTKVSFGAKWMCEIMCKNIDDCPQWCFEPGVVW